MKKVIFMGALILVFILGCSKPGGNPVSSDEVWWGSPDPETTWINLPDCCSYRVPITKESADSVCQERGYLSSSGYEPENCYVGGEKHVVLSRVGCTVD